jgi:hypothetical protein
MIYLTSIVYGTVPGNAVQEADAAAELHDRAEAYLLGNLVPALLPAGDRWCATFPWYAPGAESGGSGSWRSLTCVTPEVGVFWAIPSIGRPTLLT